MAIPGIGKPIKPFTSFDITLYLVNLKTPQIIMNNDTIAVGISICVALNKANEYKKTAGATPKDTMSDKESIFFPNSYLSTLLLFLATHPSVESNIKDNIIKIAAR